MINELVYINFSYQYDDSIVLTSGISFGEFIEAVERKPENILFLNSGFLDSEYDFHTNCDYYSGKDAEKLSEKYDIYNLGDFEWIDFKSIECLRSLSPQEIAEIYYISKQYKSINDFYFDKIDNNYIYLSHDDGHSSVIWYKSISEFYLMLGRVISNKISCLYDLVLNPFNKGIAKRLSSLSIGGVYLNLERLVVDKENRILIPVYCMEKMEYIDHMYEKVVNEKVRPKYYLKYNRVWNIVEI